MLQRDNFLVTDLRPNTEWAIALWGVSYASGQNGGNRRFYKQISIRRGPRGFIYVPGLNPRKLLYKPRIGGFSSYIDDIGKPEVGSEIPSG